MCDHFNKIVLSQNQNHILKIFEFSRPRTYALNDVSVCVNECVLCGLICVINFAHKIHETRIIVKHTNAHQEAFEQSNAPT